MISRKISGFAALAFLLLLVSCKKDDPLKNGQICDFAPYSVGSTFTFSSTTFDPFTGAPMTSQSTSEVIGTEEYLGQNWSVGESLAVGGGTGSGTGLTRCDDTGVYLLAKSANISGMQFDDLQIQLLSLPATVGKKWTSDPFSFSSGNIMTTITYESEITNTNLSLTFNGQTFNEVIEVKETVVLETGGFSFSGTVTYRYFDKEVGSIRSVIVTDSGFGFEPDTSLVQEIVSWDIK